MKIYVITMREVFISRLGNGKWEYNELVDEYNEKKDRNKEKIDRILWALHTKEEAEEVIINLNKLMYDSLDTLVGRTHIDICYYSYEEITLYKTD